MESSEHTAGPRTGIFYHPSFSRRSYLTQGSRLQDFPQALKSFLEDPRYRLYESPPIDDELILKVHSEGLLRGVGEDALCSTAWHSAGGVVLAAEKIVQGEIVNGFAFIGAGGHHSGRNYFGGYCCFNDVVLAMHVLRERYGVHRFAILDTDAHHGDGTRDLTQNDKNVLHVCVCSSYYESPDGTKIDVPAPVRPWFGVRSEESEDPDALYARTAIEAFAPRVRRFEPELIFWYFGFDTHRGDYGDIGLSRQAYMEIAGVMKALSVDVCQGRLEVVLGGGSRSDIARDVIPPIISILGNWD
jgi:acetoin utilization deacetylase AcuC-like enzyme